MDDVRISVWHRFSFDHALTAAALSRQAGRLEAEKRADTGAAGSQSEHMAYVIGSVVASFCFLEATINEFYATAGRDDLELAGGAGGMDPADWQRIASIAKDAGKLATLTQFQLALAVLHRPSLVPGARPYSDVELLRRLRNELVHYTPRMRPAESGEPGSNSDSHTLVQGLLQQGFKPNAFFADTSNPYFPQKCLGHGCTTWAWNAALAFADTFHDRVGIRPGYEDARNHGRLDP